MIDIRPRAGVGQLTFGTTRAETRLVLGSTGDVFRRSASALTASELHFEAGLVLGFDLDDRLRTVETTPRADPVLAGVRLLVPGRRRRPWPRGGGRPGRAGGPGGRLPGLAAAGLRTSSARGGLDPVASYRFSGTRREARNSATPGPGIGRAKW